MSNAVAPASSRRPHIFYLSPGPGVPNPDPAKNKMHFLSAELTGDYLCTWKPPKDEPLAEAEARVRAGLGAFGFHWLPAAKKRKPGMKQAAMLSFYVRTGLRLAREGRRPDVIVAYGPFTTAIAGLILRRRLHVPLVVEFPGHPFDAFDFFKGVQYRLKRWVAPAISAHVARTVDHVRLLHPAQLDMLDVDLSGRSSAFHNFVPVSNLPAGLDREKVLLTVGFPLKLKGADVLLRAWVRIRDRFPDWRVDILGHCPDPTPFKEIVGDDPRVRFLGGRPHAETMEHMRRCGVFVLASRTEAMGRVLLEAMAASRPIVASRVGGIPSVVNDEETGLLFESENDAALAAQLERVLGDDAYAARLGAAGHEHLRQNLSEAAYVRKFTDMVYRVAGRGRPATAAATTTAPATASTPVPALTAER